MPDRKARPRLTNLPGASPASAKRGGLLFGYFLLATQEKVARAPQGVRKLLLRTHHQEQEHRAQGALLQKSNSKSIAAEVAPTSESARCARAAGFCLCSWLPLPRFAGERAGERGCFSLPCAAVSRGRSGREAGIDRDVDAFSSGQESGRKARPRLTNLPGISPASAKRGGLLFGYFLLATQEKVARAPQGVRKLLLCINHQKQEHRAQGALLQKSKSKSIATEVAPTSDGVRRAGAIGLRLCSWLPLPASRGRGLGRGGAFHSPVRR